MIKRRASHCACSSTAVAVSRPCWKLQTVGTIDIAATSFPLAVNNHGRPRPTPYHTMLYHCYHRPFAIGTPSWRAWIYRNGWMRQCSRKRHPRLLNVKLRANGADRIAPSSVLVLLLLVLSRRIVMGVRAKHCTPHLATVPLAVDMHENRAERRAHNSTSQAPMHLKHTRPSRTRRAARRAKPFRTWCRTFGLRTYLAIG